jgi:hypothetical protein
MRTTTNHKTQYAADSNHRLADAGEGGLLAHETVMHKGAQRCTTDGVMNTFFVILCNYICALQPLVFNVVFS